MISKPALGTLALGCALAGLVLLLYARTAGFAFTDLDDDRYVLANPHLQHGLNADSLRWAAVSRYESVWIPATWVSLLADVSLHGVAPRGFHLTNIALHLANSLLVMALLRALGTGAWAAFLAAALWAAHPLNVEPAAWITGRKDLLSAAFLLAAALLHAGAARRRHGDGAPAAAAGVFVLGCAAMLAKPSAVVLPLLLIALDRLLLRPREPLRRTILRQAALLAAAAAVAIIARQAAHGGIYGSPAPVPAIERLGSAPVLALQYARRFVWPAGLCAVYPQEQTTFGLGRMLLSAALLALLTVLAWRRGRDLPLLRLGWIWFLICLLPSLNLVQGGQQLLSDRYAYAALAGASLALVQGTAARLPAAARGRIAAALLAAAGLAAAGSATRAQIDTWRDGETVWRRALAATARNHRAHAGLAHTLQRRGDLQQALEQAELAVAIQPTHQGHALLGGILADLGLLPEAQRNLEAALQLRGDSPHAWNLLGSVRGRQGDLAGARECFARAATLAPRYAQARYNLGEVLLAQGDLEGARQEFRNALALEPDHPWAGRRLQELDGR